MQDTAQLQEASGASADRMGNKVQELQNVIQIVDQKAAYVAAIGSIAMTAVHPSSTVVGCVTVVGLVLSICAAVLCVWPKKTSVQGDQSWVELSKLSVSDVLKSYASGEQSTVHSDAGQISNLSKIIDSKVNWIRVSLSLLLASALLFLAGLVS